RSVAPRISSTRIGRGLSMPRSPLAWRRGSPPSLLRRRRHYPSLERSFTSSCNVKGVARRTTRFRSVCPQSRKRTARGVSVKSDFLADSGLLTILGADAVRDGLLSKTGVRNVHHTFTRPSVEVAACRQDHGEE